MGPITERLEILKRERIEMDALLKSKEAECQEIRHQRNALEYVIDMLSRNDDTTPTRKVK